MTAKAYVYFVKPKFIRAKSKLSEAIYSFDKIECRKTDKKVIFY